jgi:hypothetical protein
LTYGFLPKIILRKEGMIKDLSYADAWTGTQRHDCEAVHEGITADVFVVIFI